jgi:sulfite dehydrogenase (quinone) subunit SoeC
MKPAGSIVFFTTASGAGYGMLFWLGLLAPFGLAPNGRGFGLAASAAALALITAGLLSSAAHLGNPARAFRALSQWRSSWLSREGIAAIATYLPAAWLALAWVITGRASAPAGLLAAVLAAATVICTAMIYASLKPIRQWYNSLTVLFYAAAGGFSGALCLAAIAAPFDPGAAARIGWLAALLGVGSAWAKLAWWRLADSSAPAATIESATGLGALGKVRSFEAPHTAENYLLKEMGFAVARRHAQKLRAYALVLAFGVPLAILAGALLGVLPVSVLAVAAVSALAGLLLERWLFFAEATHTVVLFYGRAA